MYTDICIVGFLCIEDMIKIDHHVSITPSFHRYHLHSVWDVFHTSFFHSGGLTTDCLNGWSLGGPLASCVLRLASCVLRLASCLLRLTLFILRLTLFILRLTPFIFPLASYAFHLASYAFHLPSSLSPLTLFILPLASCLLRLSSHLFPFYHEKRDVVCLCGGGSELEQVVYHGIDQSAGILMGVFFE